MSRNATIIYLLNLYNMKHFSRFWYFSILMCGLLLSCKESPPVVSLDGKWSFALDPDDAGLTAGWQTKTFADTVVLPGSLQEQGFGYDVGLGTKWTGQVVDSSWYYAPQYEKYRQAGQMKVPFWLNPDKHYVGVAWYQKEVVVPAG